MNKFRNLIRSLRLINTINKFWIVVSIILRLINGLIPLASLWVIQEIVNGAHQLISNELLSFKPLLILLLIQFSLSLVKSIIQHIKHFFNKYMELKLNYILTEKIMNKVKDISYHNFEIPSFYNHQFRIQNNYGHKFLRPIQSSLDALEIIVSVLSYTFYLFYVHWILVVIGIVAFLPTFLVQSKYGASRFNLMKYQIKVFRETNYINSLFSNKQSLKEIRVFGLAEYLIDRWKKLINTNNNEILSLLKREKKAQTGLDTITSILYGIASIVIIYLLKNNKLNIGSLVSTIQALQNLQSSINQVSTFMASIRESNYYISDYFEFIDFKEENKVNKLKSPKNMSPFPIQITNLTYQYPFSSSPSIKNLNLHIKENEKIAIVGENGSGKSTLIKNILGLYPSTNGEIYFGSYNIKNLREEDLRKHVTVIFQDYVKYQFNVKENIGFGCIEKEDNMEYIKYAAKESGASTFVEKLPNSYNTHLGKLFSGGIDLSGGQWQRIAIARAIIKDSPIIILDEPTASLDPSTEQYIFKKFHEISENKTVLFTSHRMASVKIADRIIVMKNGSIIEEGNHKYLMELNGEYARMYQKQANWYQDEASMEGANA